MHDSKTRFLLLLAAASIVTVIFAAAAGATTEKVIYAFQGGSDGYYPESALVADRSGNLYGTTLTGGGYSNCSPFGEECGVVFELTPKSGGGWTESVLHAFTGGTDGGLPYNGLAIDGKGNLYGMTYLGGTPTGGCFSSGGCGKVFRLAPPKKKGGPWKETLVYSFCSQSSCTDGAYPADVLTIDPQGNLFGTTNVGGLKGGCTNYGLAWGCGVVFELRPGTKGWTETVLYTFTGGSDGGFPHAGVSLDKAGNVYGDTSSYGTGAGTIYELKFSNKMWSQETLYSFTGESDGGYPTSPLLLDAAGSLYGTTPTGGDMSACNGAGCGNVFKLEHRKGSWTQKVLYSFTGGADGSNPAAPVVRKAKSLYGTTTAGGTGTGCGFAGNLPCGTVFELTQSGGTWTESGVYAFQAGSDGAIPDNAVLFDKNGDIFGTTYGGGDHGVYGVVYEITP